MWYKNLSLCVVIVLLVGCHHSGIKKWPQSVPSSSIFVEDYLKVTNPDATDKEIDTHLGWIKKFYLGSVLSSNGWNKMTRILVDSLADKKQKKNVEKRMRTLGVNIALEWAKDNKDRLLNTKNIIVWGNGIYQSIEESKQLPFLTQVEKDVDDLLQGKLDKSEIKNTRYFSEKDFDDF